MRTLAKGIVSIACAAVAGGLCLVACVGDDPATGPRDDASTSDSPVGSDGTTPSNDASDGGGGNPDGGGEAEAGPACDLNKPFDTALPVPNVNSTDDDSYGRLTADGLSLYLSSSRVVAGSIGVDLFVATRNSVTQPFGTPGRIAKAGGGSIGIGGGNTSAPTITGDGTTLYYLSDEVDAGGESRIFVTTRPNTLTDFGTPGQWSVSVGPLDNHPYVLPDGNTVYFVSGRTPAPAGQIKIFRVKKVGVAWGTPEMQDIPGYQAVLPVVTPDELTMYMSARPGASGSFDVYVAKRTNTGDPFGTPVRVDPASDPASADAPAFITADGCTLYFSTNKPGGPGLMDIWSTSKPK